MGGSERPLHDTGNHRPVEPYYPRWAACRGDLTNPAQTGEGGDQAELVTPRCGTRPYIPKKMVTEPARPSPSHGICFFEA